MNKKKILIIAIGLVAITLSINAYAMMGGSRGGNNQGYHMGGNNTGVNGYRQNGYMNGYNTGHNGYYTEDHMNNSDMGYNGYEQGDHMNEGYNYRRNDNRNLGPRGYDHRQETQDEGY
ncbi:MAG: hypothetical protein KKD21_06415 [Proteobacteria bacterium]|nr:hypothetical protein [Pseudomonadota bacterium]MBU1696664.1 hypothetical protein [Pseudomonadota bacterium]